jgi:hypothetical protein
MDWGQDNWPKQRPTITRRDNVVQFRVEPEFLERIDAAAREMGVTRSAAIRLLISKALGGDVLTARARQAVYDLRGAIHRAVELITPEIVQRFPEVLRQALEEQGYGTIEVGDISRDLVFDQQDDE